MSNRNRMYTPIRGKQLGSVSIVFVCFFYFNFRKKLGFTWICISFCIAKKKVKLFVGLFSFRAILLLKKINISLNIFYLLNESFLCTDDLRFLFKELLLKIWLFFSFRARQHLSYLFCFLKGRVQNFYEWKLPPRTPCT